jgi:cob(I)alamin adenosyltransferase
MKIYTKTGDQGETGLLGGVRVTKSHLAIQVCGTLDETNSFLGLAGSEALPDDIGNVLVQLQHDLFDLGSRVAACMAKTDRGADFPPSRTTDLECLIDRFELELPPLQAFILPSGSRAGCTLHLARSVCRRAERELVELMELGLEVRLANELVYLNRLGDLLFVLARVINRRQHCLETEWNVGRNKRPSSTE